MTGRSKLQVQQTLDGLRAALSSNATSSTAVLARAPSRARRLRAVLKGTLAIKHLRSEAHPRTDTLESRLPLDGDLLSAVGAIRAALDANLPAVQHPALGEFPARLKMNSWLSNVAVMPRVRVRKRRQRVPLCREGNTLRRRCHVNSSQGGSSVVSAAVPSQAGARGAAEGAIKRQDLQCASIVLKHFLSAAGSRCACWSAQLSICCTPLDIPAQAKHESTPTIAGLAFTRHRTQSSGPH